MPAYRLAAGLAQLRANYGADAQAENKAIARFARGRGEGRHLEREEPRWDHVAWSRLVHSTPAALCRLSVGDRRGVGPSRFTRVEDTTSRPEDVVVCGPSTPGRICGALRDIDQRASRL